MEKNIRRKVDNIKIHLLSHDTNLPIFRSSTKQKNLNRAVKKTKSYKRKHTTEHTKNSSTSFIGSKGTCTMGRSSKQNKNVRKSGYIFEYRFTLLGGAKSGKSSILNRFISDTFTHRYRPTIEDHVTHTIDHKGNICVCLMVDTCGSDDFPAMKRLAITKGNAFLLIYAIDNRKSFIEAKRIAEEIISLKDTSEDVKIMLIANKSDLEDQREVEKQEGLDLVSELNTGNVSSMFFEVSACQGDGIKGIFTELLQMFIPEPTEMTYISEKSAFSRMSFRRRSKKKQQMMQRPPINVNNKNKSLPLDANKKNNNDLSDNVYYSDTEIEPSKSRLHPGTATDHKGQLVRSSSATSNRLPDSDSGVDSSPNQSPLLGRKVVVEDEISPQRRESSAKEIIRKTFGSMQRIFVKPNETGNTCTNNNNNLNPSTLVRSDTGDSTTTPRKLSAFRKQTTL